MQAPEAGARALYTKRQKSNKKPTGARAPVGRVD